MKNLINSGAECDYSFEMLYKAAFGKRISKREKTQFQSFDQEKINFLVAKWAKKAGWNTNFKRGSDGSEYLSFYPTKTGTLS